MNNLPIEINFYLKDRLNCKVGSLIFAGNLSSNRKFYSGWLSGESFIDSRNLIKGRESHLVFTESVNQLISRLSELFLNYLDVANCNVYEILN